MFVHLSVCLFMYLSVWPPFWVALWPIQLALRSLQLALRPLHLALKPFQLALRPLQLALRPLLLALGPFLLALKPLLLAFHAGGVWGPAERVWGLDKGVRWPANRVWGPARGAGGWADGQMDKWNFSPFYRTLSPFETVALLVSEIFQHQNSRAREILTIQCVWVTG